ncbi:MAG TPA: DinB family protein, partial [Pirellulaceae bacterium]|nr:DinB family protein [Pirellulaceae bacterium]
MNVHEAIKCSIEAGSMVCLAYLADLSDDDLMRRACPGINHINWQVGHLIASEHDLVNMAVPGSMPELPEGFAAKYGKATATSDDASQFCTKAELMAAYETQRAGTPATLAKLSEADLDRPTGVTWAPNVSALMAMQGWHWLMHSGQWA